MANVKNYRQQGGDHWVIGGRQSYDDGTTVASTPLGIGFTIGADAGTTITVNIQLYADPQNTVEVSNVCYVPFYLTSSTSTLALASATSGGIAAGTDGALVETIDNLAGYIVSEADGDMDMVLTEAGAGTWYIAALMPDGRVVTSDAITFS